MDRARTVDVVVVGSGAARPRRRGQCGAPHAGRRVMALEAAPLLGGATAFSGGMAWVPLNRHLAEVGGADTRDEALSYLHGL